MEVVVVVVGLGVRCSVRLGELLMTGWLSDE